VIEPTLVASIVAAAAGAELRGVGLALPLPGLLTAPFRRNAL